MPNAELARRVGLSEAQCLRRVHTLEHRGTIRQYRAVIDLNAVGLSVMAFVELRVDCPTKSRVASFERAIGAREEVIECWRINGDTDYLLRASVADLVAYERLLTEGLIAQAGVSVVRSHLALRNVKASTASLPLGPIRTTSTVLALDRLRVSQYSRPKPKPGSSRAGYSEEPQILAPLQPQP